MDASLCFPLTLTPLNHSSTRAIPYHLTTIYTLGKVDTFVLSGFETQHMQVLFRTFQSPSLTVKSVTLILLRVQFQRLGVKLILFTVAGVSRPW